MVRLRYTALILGLALVATACVAAQEPQAQAPQAQAPQAQAPSQPQAQAPSVLASTPTAPAAPAAAAEGDGTSEGIQVHGQWTIEVRDPDGTVVSRREFENAFVGNVLLRDMVAGYASIVDYPGTGSPWLIKLRGDYLLNCPIDQIPYQSGCFDASGAEVTLVDASSFRLTNSFIFTALDIGNSFMITGVETLANADYANASLDGFTLFTAKDFAVAEYQPLAPNQTVYVDVVISFS